MCEMGSLSVVVRGGKVSGQRQSVILHCKYSSELYFESPIEVDDQEPHRHFGGGN